ncbi:MAG: LptF/LptG family permease [Caulobacteraceae bacterium]
MIRSKKIDRYMLELMTRPVVGCLAVTLTSLLLERILRLFNELAQNGADFGFVLQITVNLVPQYLTLALPASFFVSIFIVIARLGDDNEIDAILASGVSISRLSAPFIGLGLAFTLVSLVLFGFLQPYGRYAYLQVLNMAIHAGWSAQLQPQVFVDPGHGLTITADEVGMSGRKLHGVFVRQVSADGRERISTAHEGELTTSVDKTMVELHMDKGIQLDRMPGQPGKILQFQNVTVAEPMGDMGGKIAPRGGDVRELTLLELVRELRHKNSVLPHTALRSELYGRLVRDAVGAVPAAPGHPARHGGQARAARPRPDPGRGPDDLVPPRGADGGEPRPRRPHQPRAADLDDLFRVHRPLHLAVPVEPAPPRRHPAQPLRRRPGRRGALAARAVRARAGRRDAVTLDRYVLRLLLVRTIMAAVVLVGLVQILELLDVTTAIFDRGLGLAGIGHYSLLRLPGMFQQVAALSVMIGSLFTFTQMSRTSEMVVIRATGANIYRVLQMMAPVAIGVALLDFVIAAEVAPRTQDELVHWMAVTAPAAEQTKAPKAHWFRLGPEVVMVEDASANGERLTGVRIYRRNAEHLLVEEISAPSATPEPGGWRLHGAQISRVVGSEATLTPPAEQDWKTRLTPSEVVRLYRATDQISSSTAVAALTRAIPIDRSPDFYRTRLYRTFAEPLGALVMLLLSAPAALGTLRSPQGVRLMLFGLISGLLFLVVDGLLTALGEASALPPFLASWSAPIAFAALGVTALLYLEG